MLKLHVDSAAQPRWIGCIVSIGSERHGGIVRGIEDREDAQHVGRIVDGHSLNGKDVVRLVAALDVQPRIQLAACLHSWQHLGIVDGIGIAKHLRQIVEHLCVPQHRSVLSQRDSSGGCLTGNHHRLHVFLACRIPRRLPESTHWQECDSE